MIRLTLTQSIFLYSAANLFLLEFEMFTVSFRFIQYKVCNVSKRCCREERLTKNQNRTPLRGTPCIQFSVTLSGNSWRFLNYIIMSLFHVTSEPWERL